jgi:uncharacterized protein (DUF2249 family)
MQCLGELKEGPKNVYPQFDLQFEPQFTLTKIEKDPSVYSVEKDHLLSNSWNSSSKT